MLILKKIIQFVSIATCLVIPQACNENLRSTSKELLAQNRKLRRRSLELYQLTAQHRIAEAIPLYFDLAKQANAAGDDQMEAKSLINAGGCQVWVFRYQDALATLEHARKVTERSGNPDYIAVANANIASLYMQMANYHGAEIASNRALSTLRAGNPQFSRVIIPLAQAKAELNDLVGAEVLFRQAIEGAYSSGDLDTVAWAWDYLGHRYFLALRIRDAERALTESLRVRKMFNLSDLGSSYYQLGMVRAEQADYRSAAFLFDAAIEELKKPGNIVPAWNIYKERGKFYAQAKDLEKAWENLGKAVDLARGWRAEVVNNDANRTSVEAELSELYSLYIEVGNQYAASHNVSLARETFEAAEENRAASLRALAERETSWHNKLAPIYWQYLNYLQNAERKVLQDDSPENRSIVIHLRTSLDEMEAAAGAPRNSVIEPAATATQRKLDGDTVLLSFQLGKHDSWLWAVTHDEIAVFALPPRATISGQIREFDEYVRRGSPNADQAGLNLYRTLFGKLPERYSQHERWLFSLDQELFSLPFPALVSRFEGGKPVYLGVTHAVAATPGAIMFASTSRAPDFEGKLLGVGDAIYNRADSRLAPSIQTAGFPQHLGRKITGENFLFARLWGAGKEMAAISQTWGPRESVVLSGIELSKNRLWEELSRKPAVVHFATHILEANDQLHTGWIALSIDKEGRPEFLSPAEISAHRISSGLVVLNGCSSGTGEIRAASGLMGLTRAWFASGATEVLATRWPGADDAGTFFASFYQELKSPEHKGAAYALRSACRRSIAAGGWRAKPEFWASYFLTSID